MIQIYHNPRCKKSREALHFLENSGKEFEIIKYLEAIPTKDELKTIIGFLGIDARDLVRKNERVWKEKFKNKTLSDDEVMDAMISYPKLIERPIIVNNGRAVIARPLSNIVSLID